MGKLVAALAVLAAGGLVVVVAVVPAPEESLAPPQLPPVNVRVMTVEPIPTFRDTFSLPGVVEPNAVIRVSAEVAGRIERLDCREGQTCRAGDKLVKLNTDLLKAEYDRAKATMDFDAREQERIAQLVRRGVGTANELDQARSRAQTSRATFDAAKARLDRAAVAAPVAGVIDNVPVEAGEYVQPGQVVAKIVDVGIVKVVVHVPERDVHYLRVGQQEEIAIDSLGGRKVTGTITFISELADEKARTTRVEISVDNARRLLRSGQILRVRLSRRVLKDVVLVPLAAVIPLEDGRAVYVAAGGRAERRMVELGFFRGRSVQVTGGQLAPGDKLIVSGHRYVGPGQPVRVIGAAEVATSAPAPTSRPGADGAGKAGGRP